MKKEPVASRQTLEETVPADLFRAEVAAWDRQLEVGSKDVRIQPMKRKGASRSSKGRLTFDTDLLRRQPLSVGRPLSTSCYT